jgi:hypothetical protein
MRRGSSEQKSESVTDFRLTPDKQAVAANVNNLLAFPRHILITTRAGAGAMFSG